MADQRRRRRPAALSAFNAAFPLGLGGTALFSLLFRDEGLLGVVDAHERMDRRTVVTWPLAEPSGTLEA